MIKEMPYEIKLGGTHMKSFIPNVMVQRMLWCQKCKRKKSVGYC